MCVPSSIPSYSVAIGLVLYAAIYLYLLFYHEDYIGIFNKFIIYIIGVDLLLSAFYYLSANDTTQSNELSHDLNIADNFGNLHSIQSSQHVHPLDAESDDDTNSDISDNSTQHSYDIDDVANSDTSTQESFDIDGGEQLLPSDEPQDHTEQYQNNLETEEESHDGVPDCTPSNPDTAVAQNDNSNQGEPAVTIKKRRGRPPKNAVQLN